VKEKAQRRYWGDGEQGEVALESYAAQTAAKRAKYEPSGDTGDTLNASDLLARSVSKVGTQNPIQDFRDMLSRRDADHVSEAIRQMCDVINKLVAESIKDMFYQKALDCVRELRRGCVVVCSI